MVRLGHVSWDIGREVRPRHYVKFVPRAGAAAAAAGGGARAGARRGGIGE